MKLVVTVKAATDEYTPGEKVCPPSSPAIEVAGKESNCALAIARSV
jgi:hypothetical protein